jgi:hypothetical protein
MGGSVRRTTGGEAVAGQSKASHGTQVWGFSRFGRGGRKRPDGRGRRVAARCHVEGSELARKETNGGERLLL